MQTKEKMKILTEEQQVLQEMLMDDLETMQVPVPYLENVMDEEIRQDLQDNIEQKEGFKEAFDLQLDMMINLFSAESVEDMTARADEMLTKTKTQAIENQKIILETIRPWEKTLRSLNLFFQNASTSGTVKDASFVTVDPAKFAGAANPKHFKILANELEERFYAWVPEESPMYISYAGDIEDGANALAKLAEKTIALAVVDTVDSSSAEATLKRTQSRNLSGTQSEWGHLAVSGTYLIARGAKENIENKALSIPSSPAIAGKLMSTKLGDSIAGFESGAISEAKGVRYKSGRRQSKQFGDRGMLIIGWEEATAFIFGDTTANKSDNKLLRKVSKMMVHNKVMKDIIAFCNRKAYSKWGRPQQQKFKAQIEDYLNDLVRLKVIQGYDDVVINQLNDDEVSVTLGLQFFTTISRYLISVEENNVTGIEKL